MNSDQIEKIYLNDCLYFILFFNKMDGETEWIASLYQSVINTLRDDIEIDLYVCYWKVSQSIKRKYKLFD